VEEVKEKKFPWKIILSFVLAVILCGEGAVYYFASEKTTKNDPTPVAASAQPSITLPTVPKPAAPVHASVPAEVRGIYITSQTAGDRERLAAIVDLVKGRGINALVVDLKNEDGSLAFSPKADVLKAEAQKSVPLGDLSAFASKVHGDGFYVIGRIAVFEDPNYAINHPEFALKLASGKLWTDTNGLAWLDPASTDVWKYNATVAEEAYLAGFDEIQFDYIRFATDGATSAIIFPIYDKKKETYRQVISRFFSYLDSELGGKGIPISADVFGFVTWHQSDLGIGQWYDDAIRTMDYVSPMVYPSHYPTGVLKYKNPADHPFEIISDSLKKGGEVILAAAAESPSPKLATQRPWLQAFNMGAIYTPEMIMNEVKAARANNVSGFLFWNARNDYSSLPNLSE
jgi:hypothetical protein